MLVPARLASASALSSPPSNRLLSVREEADAGPVGERAALVGAIQVIAGYPQARAGDQHVVGTEPASPGGVVGQRAGGRAQPLDAGRGDRPGTREIAAVGVRRPALVPGEVRGARVGRGG